MVVKIATPNRLRAALCIAFPFAAVAIGWFILDQNGVDPHRYFNMIANGELSWTRQGTGWLALIFWVVVVYPKALSALSNSCLIFVKEGRLWSYGRPIALVSLIKNPRIKKSFMRMDLLVDVDNRTVNCGSVVLASERSDLITEGMHAALSGS